MDRRKAREEALGLIFESEFQALNTKEEIIELATDARELENDEYMREVFYASMEHREEIDALISKYAVGWSLKRVSKVALAVMRLSIAEMLYMEDIPFQVSINEALELIKRYDHDVPPKFVNGVLNAVAQGVGLKGKVLSEEPAADQAEV